LSILSTYQQVSSSDHGSADDAWCLRKSCSLVAAVVA
jgi:hypothetical protein